MSNEPLLSTRPKSKPHFKREGLGRLINVFSPLKHEHTRSKKTYDCY